MRALLGAILLCAACGGSGEVASSDDDAGASAPSCGALGAACRSDGTCAGSLSCAGGVCGCSHDADCPGGGTCTSGRCLVTLARDQAGPYPIAVDATSVYWANQGYMGANTIAKVAIGGGTPTTLASFGAEAAEYGATGFALAGTGVYWSTDTAVMTVARSGGTPITLASASLLTGIAVDATSVYWVQVMRGDTIMKMPLGGGAAVALVQAQSNVYGFTVDGTNLYWSQPGAIMKVALGGGPPTVLESLPGAEAFGLLVDGSSIFWVDDRSVRRIEEAPLAGGAPTTLASGMDVTTFAVDDTSVYWTDGFAGTVTKVPRGGGTPTTLFTGDVPWAIAVDATSVYWTSPSGGTVMRLSPK